MVIRHSSVIDQIFVEYHEYVKYTPAIDAGVNFSSFE